ncbi:hypothetical protein EJB05_04925, partial [Eragrostis curvula]
MAQRRGSATRGNSAVVLALVLLCVLLHGEFAESAVYTVGDRGGWSFNTAAWTRGKRFRAGDVLGECSISVVLVTLASRPHLLFKYSPAAHNVVAVSAAGYKSCSAPRGAKMFRSGNDRVTLRRGTNYFICSFPGHCQYGMKIAINAA